MKKKIIKKVAKKVVDKVTGKKKPKIKKKTKPKTVPIKKGSASKGVKKRGRIKPGPKTANPANAPITQDFAKISKGAKFKDMESADKTKFVENFFGKGRRSSRRLGKSRPEIGLSFKEKNKKTFKHLIKN